MVLVLAAVAAELLRLEQASNPAHVQLTDLDPKSRLAIPQLFSNRFCKMVLFLEFQPNLIEFVEI